MNKLYVKVLVTIKTGSYKTGNYKASDVVLKNAKFNTIRRGWTFEKLIKAYSADIKAEGLNENDVVAIVFKKDGELTQRIKKVSNKAEKKLFYKRVPVTKAQLETLYEVYDMSGFDGISQQRREAYKDQFYAMIKFLCCDFGDLYLEDKVKDEIFDYCYKRQQEEKELMGV